MSDQFNFTLRFSHNYSTNKTRLRIDFVPEFSTELKGRTEIPDFNPSRIRQALHFVSGEVIRRVVEHLRKSDLKNPKSQSAWDQRKEALDQWKAAYNKGNMGEAEKASKLMDPHDQKIAKQVEALINDWKAGFDEKLTSISFEEMSEGAASYSVQKVANTDVPPPRWP